MGFKEHIGKLIMVEVDDEIYEGILMGYDEEHFIIDVDGDGYGTHEFVTAACGITLSDELIIPDHAAFLAKIAEMLKMGKFIFDGGKTKQ